VGLWAVSAPLGVSVLYVPHLALDGFSWVRVGLVEIAIGRSRAVAISAALDVG
jgi:hypothetical protein